MGNNIEAPVYTGVEDADVEHKCAIVGIYDPDGEPVAETIRGLGHMNHRGQEGSKTAVSKRDGFLVKGGPGWVSQAYTKTDIRILTETHSPIAVGQNRYSTSGDEQSLQPFYSNDEQYANILKNYNQKLLPGYIALTHNGDVTNAMDLYNELPEDLKLLAKNDTGIVFLHILIADGSTWEEKIKNTVNKCEGACNFIIGVNDGEADKLVVYRDPYGFHPLSIARLPKKNEESRQGYAVMSETAPYSVLGAEYIRDVLPGEALVIDKNGINTIFIDNRVSEVQLSQCIFELIYFSAPDSYIFGIHISELRRRIGASLADKYAEAGELPDVIMPVQHSGITYAEGFAARMIELLLRNPKKFGYDPDDPRIPEIAASLQTKTGLVANIYANGRSFINPSERATVNQAKHRVDADVVSWKRVVVIDDSIVRANAAITLVKLLIEAHATDIVFASAFSFVRHPCFTGIDFHNPDELIINKVKDESEVAKVIKVNKIIILTPTELIRLVTKDETLGMDGQDENEIYNRVGYCGSCILKNPNYPVKVNNLLKN
jgi:amidophosphoribosyltransferase